MKLAIMLIIFFYPTNYCRVSHLRHFWLFVLKFPWIANLSTIYLGSHLKAQLERICFRLTAIVTDRTHFLWSQQNKQDPFPDSSYLEAVLGIYSMDFTDHNLAHQDIRKLPPIRQTPHLLWYKRTAPQAWETLFPSRLLKGSGSHKWMNRSPLGSYHHNVCIAKPQKT